MTELNKPNKVECYRCNEDAKYHHTSSPFRKDGYITVWYKCKNRHKTFIDIKMSKKAWE